MGDLSCEPTELVISDFMENYSFVHLVKNPTCYKSENPKYIDLILTSNKNNFQKINTIETGLSEFHAMIVIILKSGFTKQESKVITYRDYKHFQPKVFQLDLLKYIYIA